jgi:hypothetical protein
MLTYGSSAWAVSCTAGLAAGVILGAGVTTGSIASVTLIAIAALGICGSLLQRLNCGQTA